jgi:hypothetical protein
VSSSKEWIVKTKARYSTLLPLAAAVAGFTVALPVPALANPLPYGPDTCIQGYVWREARPSDHVCVAPPIRDATAQQNANAAQNVEPGGGAYGPATCKQTFVWRNAFDGDVVCVTVSVRDQAAKDNDAAQSRYQRNQPDPKPAQPPEDKGTYEPPDWNGGGMTAGGGGGGGEGRGDVEPGVDYCNRVSMGPSGQVADGCMLAP